VDLPARSFDLARPGVAPPLANREAISETNQVSCVSTKPQLSLHQIGAMARLKALIILKSTVYDCGMYPWANPGE